MLLHWTIIYSTHIKYIMNNFKQNVVNNIQPSSVVFLHWTLPSIFHQTYLHTSKGHVTWIIKKVNKIPTHCGVAYDSVRSLARDHVIRVWASACACYADTTHRCAPPMWQVLFLLTKFTTISLPFPIQDYNFPIHSFHRYYKMYWSWIIFTNPNEYLLDQGLRASG